MGMFDEYGDEETPPGLTLDENGKVVLKTPEAGPPVSAASTPVQYERLAADNTDIDKAKSDAESSKFGVTLAQGIGQMFGANKNNGALFDSLRDGADKRVAGAKSDKAQKLEDLLNRSKLQRQGTMEQRDDMKFGWEQGEQTEKVEYNKPGTRVSQAAGATALTRIDQAIKEGASVGADIGSLTEFRNGILANKYSAKDIKDAGALGDFKDLLNNKAAMARLLQQGQHDDAREKTRAASQTRLESQLKSKRENDLRSHLNDPIMKQAARGRIAWEQFNSNIDLGTPAGAEAALLLWQKGLDPVSVVRETEFARTPAMQGLTTRAEAIYQKMAGGGPVTADMAAQLKQAMTQLQGAYSGYAREKLGVIDHNVQEYGLTKENIYGDLYTDISNKTNPTTTPTPEGGQSPQAAAQPATNSPPASVAPTADETAILPGLREKYPGKSDDVLLKALRKKK